MAFRTGAGQRGLCVSASRRCQRSAEDYWLTLAAGLQVLGFAMLAMDTTSSAAEARSPMPCKQRVAGPQREELVGPEPRQLGACATLYLMSYLESYLNEHISSTSIDVYIFIQSIIEL